MKSSIFMVKRIHFCFVPMARLFHLRKVARPVGNILQKVSPLPETTIVGFKRLSRRSMVRLEEQESSEHGQLNVCWGSYEFSNDEIPILELRFSEKRCWLMY